MTETTTLKQQLQAGIQQHADSAALFQQHASTLQNAIQIVGGSGTGSDNGGSGNSSAASSEEGFLNAARPILYTEIDDETYENADGVAILGRICGMNNTTIYRKPTTMAFIKNDLIHHSSMSDWSFRYGATTLFVRNDTDNPISRAFRYGYSGRNARLFSVSSDGTLVIDQLLSEETSAKTYSSHDDPNEVPIQPVVSIPAHSQVAIILSINSAYYASQEYYTKYVGTRIDSLNAFLSTDLTIDVAMTQKAHQSVISSLTELWD